MQQVRDNHQEPGFKKICENNGTASTCVHLYNSAYMLGQNGTHKGELVIHICKKYSTHY